MRSRHARECDVRICQVKPIVFTGDKSSLRVIVADDARFCAMFSGADCWRQTPYPLQPRHYSIRGKRSQVSISPIVPDLTVSGLPRHFPTSASHALALHLLSPFQLSQDRRQRNTALDSYFHLTQLLTLI